MKCSVKRWHNVKSQDINKRQLTTMETRHNLKLFNNFVVIIPQFQYNMICVLQTDRLFCHTVMCTTHNNCYYINLPEYSGKLLATWDIFSNLCDVSIIFDLRPYSSECQYVMMITIYTHIHLTPYLIHSRRL